MRSCKCTLFSEPTLTLFNLTTLLKNVKWYDVGGDLWIPTSKLDMIRQQHHESQCSLACWELYLNEAPFPCWKRVAWALYHHGYIEELKIVQKNYIKRESAGNTQFKIKVTCAIMTIVQYIYISNSKLGFCWHLVPSTF